MPTIEVRLAITLGDDATKALAEVLGPLLQHAVVAISDAARVREARLRASQDALFTGQVPPDGQGLLIDIKEAAKLLKVSERTLWRLHDEGHMPRAIRLGRSVRWSLDVLNKWVEAGCPAGPHR